MAQASDIPPDVLSRSTTTQTSCYYRNRSKFLCERLLNTFPDPVGNYKHKRTCFYGKYITPISPLQRIHGGYEQSDIVWYPGPQKEFQGCAYVRCLGVTQLKAEAHQILTRFLSLLHVTHSSKMVCHSPQFHS